MSARALLLTGSTGLVGARLSRALERDGWEIRCPSRRARPAHDRSGSVRWLQWDGTTLPTAALSGCEAVVHLAGEPVFGGLPTAARLARIRSSRVDSTRAIVDAISQLPEPERPATFVCASAVGYYGDRGEQELDEDAEPGEGFLADVCVDWEDAAAGATRLGLRVVSLRIGIVLAREGGALPMMALPFRFGLGGRLGSGRQWVPWIHVEDLVRLIERALDPSGTPLEGPVNAVAGNVRNAELTRALAETLRRPALIPVPAFAVRAALDGLALELIGSHRVRPRAAESAGFEFRHTQLAEALAEALA